MWPAKRDRRNVALRLHTSGKEISFTIDEEIKADTVGGGTVKRGALTCPVCGFMTPVPSVRRQARQQGLRQRLIAVVTTLRGAQGRRYRLPTQADLDAVAMAKQDLERRAAEHTGPLSLVPDEPFPAHDGRAFTPGVYGVTTWGDLLTPRQALALSTFARLVRESRNDIAIAVGDRGLADAIVTCLGLAVDRQAEASSSLCRWNPAAEKMQATFGRQALPIVWDFAESNPFGASVGDWRAHIANVLIAEETAQLAAHAGSVVCTTATELPLADASVLAVVTDPPYYDAVPYADLSDFFYVWLRRSLDDIHPDLLGTRLTPKGEEIVVNPASLVDGHKKSGAFFEAKMREAFREMRRVLRDDGIGSSCSRISRRAVGRRCCRR